MKPYDPDAHYPKCGGDDISTHYEAGQHLLGLSGSWCWVKDKHLDRHCRNCSYKWAEACLDAKENP